MAQLRRLLDIVRIVVSATDDDDVFDAAGDVDLSVPNKAKISSAHEGGLIASRKADVERRGRVLRTVPISRRYTWPRKPDFSDFAIGQGNACRGVYDGQPVSRTGAAAPDDPCRLSRSFFADIIRARDFTLAGRADH